MNDLWMMMMNDKKEESVVQANARELLKKLMKKRNWHGIKNDVVAQRQAAMDKHLALNDRLSYEKSKEWLIRLGWNISNEEVWCKKLFTK